MAEGLTYPFGDRQWLNVRGDDLPMMQTWLQTFRDSWKPESGDGSKISASERTTLLSTSLPPNLTISNANVMLDRWNNTMSN